MEAIFNITIASINGGSRSSVITMSKASECYEILNKMLKTLIRHFPRIVTDKNLVMLF